MPRHSWPLLYQLRTATNAWRRLRSSGQPGLLEGNRSAAVRIPLTECPSAKRVEFRPPDPAANPYLTFAALLMAGLDGIRHHIDPSDHGFGPVDRDLYHMSNEELREIRSVPGSLSEALDALESDYSFLLEGNVFTTDILEQYVKLKRAQSDAVGLLPTPIEFALYYDA
jgi:glutamine synthetase